MDLESVILSEVCQKEKSKYRIIMHICGIQKNGIDHSKHLQNNNQEQEHTEFQV